MTNDTHSEVHTMNRRTQSPEPGLAPDWGETLADVSAVPQDRTTTPPADARRARAHDIAVIAAGGPPPRFEYADDRPHDIDPPLTTRGGWLRHRAVVRLLAYASVLGMWQYLSISNDRVPGVEAVVSFMFTEVTGGAHDGVLTGTFWSPLGQSVLRFTIGLAVGVALGTAIGIALGASRWLRALFNDTTLVLLTLPSVVWAFVASLWFGLSNAAPILAVALTALPFVAVSLSSGIRGLDRGLVEMSRAYRVRRRHRTLRLYLGGTVSSFVTGLRLAIMTGWSSLLIVEWFGATSGVGWRARFWFDALRYPGFVGWVFLFVVAIAVTDRLLLRPLSKRALRHTIGVPQRFGEDWGL